MQRIERKQGFAKNSNHTKIARRQKNKMKQIFLPEKAENPKNERNAEIAKNADNAKFAKNAKYAKIANKAKKATAKNG